MKTLEGIRVIRIHNKLKDDIQIICAKLIYLDQIIGEVQIRYGSKPLNYYGNQFMSDLKAAGSVAQVKQKIFQRLNRIAENRQIYVPKMTELNYNVRQKDIAKELGGEVKGSKMSKNEEEHYILTRNDQHYNYFIEKYEEKNPQASVDDFVNHWLKVYNPMVTLIEKLTASQFPVTFTRFNKSGLKDKETFEWLKVVKHMPSVEWFEAKGILRIRDLIE